MTVSEEFYDWLADGIAKGFCTDVVCGTHVGLPLSQQEELDWEEGMDACIYGVRILVDSELRAEQLTRHV
jgi:hypothetical protein